jgi:hypothetical protein
MASPETDAEDSPSVAEVIERCNGMRDVDRIAQGQHDDRRAQPDAVCNGGSEGQHDHWIEGVGVVDRILGHPQVGKSERLGTARDVADRRRRNHVW